MICVDASVVLAWLLPEEITAKAILARRRWNEDGETLIAPSFLPVEVTSVLRRSVYHGRISLEEGQAAFDAFQGFAIRYHPSEILSEAAWLAAQRMNASKAYDMFYLALAEANACELWTADERLVNLVSGRSDVARWVGNLSPEGPQL